MNMIQNAWKTLDHRYVSNCIFTILNLLEKFPKAFDFALESIIESDIIFTNYNYSEIKKTFNLSKVIEDSMKENVDDDLELFDEDEPSDDES
jgi:hypothetical protein